MIKCPKCSMSMTDGTKFCTSCGAALEPEKVQSAAEVTVTCSKCGAPLALNAKSCSSCGAPVVVVEEIASAEPVPPMRNAAVTAGQTAETTTVQPLFPIATAQGYRCPTCEAFLQPGSTFCANCATKFAEAVPLGSTAAHTGMNPAIPLAAAATALLAGGIFAGWMIWGRPDDVDQTVASHTATTIDRPSETVTTTDAMTVVPAPQAEAPGEIAIRIFNAARAGDWVVIYNAADMGDGSTQVTDAETFGSQIEVSLGPDRDAFMRVGSLIDNVRAGEPVIEGDRATVPVNFTVTVDGRSVEGTSTVRLVRRNGVWKLDLSGDPQTIVQTVRDAMIPATVLQQVQTPSAPPTGTTGNFQATTGTTGMGP